jgi:hypothetical protein
MNQAEFFQRLSQPCPHPEGTRIRLIQMGDDPDAIPPGALGAIVGGSGAQLWMRWDDGRTLHLIIGVDQYEVLS